MKKHSLKLFVIGAMLCTSAVSYAGPPDICSSEMFKTIDPNASQPLKLVVTPPILGSCKSSLSHGLPIPDPKCSPGAINPTLTSEVLKTKGFTTRCVRDRRTSAAQKVDVYAWYGVAKPLQNRGPTQTCELDHIIPLELGGADTLDNIWPQCGPENVGLEQRFFKQKDAVENFLKAQVKVGKISLEAAQRGIAEDWTQFLKDVEK